MRGFDIICFSCIDWDFLWQADQEIMARIAAQGNRVLFVENTGVRAPTWRDLPRLRSRLRNWRRGTQGFRGERDNLFVYSPVILPFPYSRIACWINRRLLIGALRRWMRAAGCGRPTVWTFLPTPLVHDVLTELDPSLVVYYCVDDMASSSRQARRVSRSEARIVRRADVVFTTSERSRQRAARLNERVYCLPAGVDFGAFEHVRLSADGIPADLSRISKPIVGYVGGVHQWMDQALLAQVAERLPHVQFVFVGPVQSEVSRLSRCPNVHLLGARPHHDVAHYVKGFDVGIVPYQLSEYTANVYPTKLNEYLAMGIPVVVTDLPEAQRFNRDHGEILAVARNVEEFTEALRQAVARPPTPAEAARRIEVARQNSWDNRLSRISSIVDEVVAQRQAVPSRWEESLRSLYRTTRRRVARLVVTATILYLVLFQTPLLWWVGGPLRISQIPRQADAVVVFGGGVGESGIAGQGYEERVKYAAQLWHQQLAPRILLVSGSVYAMNETSVMKALAVSLGIPADAILIEDRAGSTYQYVRATAAEAGRRGWRRLALVTSPYHMRRASLVFHRQAPALDVLYTPIPQSVFYDPSQGVRLRHYRGILHEYIGIVYYKWKGYL